MPKARDVIFSGFMGKIEMRTFGIWVAVAGAILGLTVWGFGWLLLIIGLLMMIAGSLNRSEEKKETGPQSSGGYAGLKKKDVSQYKDLSAETIASWAIVLGVIVLGLFLAGKFVVGLDSSGNKTSKFNDIAESFSLTSSLTHDECVNLGHYKIQMWRGTMKKFCKMESTPSNPRAKTCTPVTRFLDEEQIKSMQTAIKSRHSGEKGTWELWARDVMRYIGQCT